MFCPRIWLFEQRTEHIAMDFIDMLYWEESAGVFEA